MSKALKNGWMESYRGSVFAWETDMVEHFTVAFYFDRFTDAVLALSEEVGLGPSTIREEQRAAASVACDVRYLKEMRGGDIFHIESGIIAVDDKRLKVGHKVIDSATGDLTTTMEHTCLHFSTAERRAMNFPDAQKRTLTDLIQPWDVPGVDPQPDPENRSALTSTLRDSTKPHELDVLGHVSIPFYVHRWAAAGGQLLGKIGVTPAFMREQRRGLSTFDMQARFLREMQPGTMVEIRSGFTHIGRSSMRMFHEMRNLNTGEIAATLHQAGVLLDLDARRPAALPDSAKAAADAFRLS